MENTVSLFFGLCFAACVGWFFRSLRELCNELNRALPSDRKVTLYPPTPKTLGQLYKYNILNHSLQLLQQHGQYYPASPLPGELGQSVVAAALSLIGVFLTLR